MTFLRRLFRSDSLVPDLNSEVASRYFLNLTKLNHRKTSISTAYQKPFSLKYSTAVESENHDFSLILRKTESLQSSHFVRNLLYPETEDELINNLKSCISVEEVIRIIENNDSLNKQQIAQVVLILRDLQKVHILQTQFNMLGDNSLLINELKSHPAYLKLLNLVEDSIPHMNLSEMTSCLLYLTKLDQNLEKSVLIKLVIEVEKCLSENHDAPLSDFARFFMTTSEYDSLWSLYSMNNFVPIIVKRLENCDNYNDFRHISICFQKCNALLNDHHVQIYLSKANSLLLSQTNLDEIDRVRTALKAVMFLKVRSSNDNCRNVMMALLKTLQGRIHNLCFQEVFLLQKVIINFQEPYQLLKEINEISKKWFLDFETISKVPSYIFQVTFLGNNLRPESEKDIEKSLVKYLTLPIRPTDTFDLTCKVDHLLFNTNLKLNKKITDLYWMKAVNILSSDGNDNHDAKYWTLIKYIHLIKLNPCSRNYQFEKWIIAYAIHSLTTNPVMQHSSKNYMILTMAILTFHKRPFSIINDNTMEKLLAIIPRLNIYDNLFFSFMLNLAKQFFNKNEYQLKIFLGYYVHLISASNENVLNTLKSNPQIDLNRLSKILSSHVIKGGKTSSEIFEQIRNRLCSYSVENLYSKLIQDMLSNLQNCNYLIPQFTDLAVEYCIEKKDDISENCISAVLIYCYSFGYEPKRIDEFLSIAKEIIYRNKDRLMIGKYVHSANALIYFGDLPSTFCDHIFNIEFLQQIDEKCAKTNKKYASTIKRELMILNRTICIQYPFREVPWFHEEYCKEKSRFIELNSNKDFFADVLNTLKSVVNDSECIQTQFVSSYGHFIDIILYLDKNGQPTCPDYYNSNELRKIAILLKRGSLQQYYLSKGVMELLVRELEMLNYEVKLINKCHWYSMYMSEPIAKVNYLKELIRLNIDECVSQ